MPHKENGYYLGTWVNAQRQNYKKGGISEDRIKLLESFPGWTWDPLEDAFQEGLASLRSFVEREGHARVPHKHKENGYSLGVSVNAQRKNYKKAGISEELSSTPSGASSSAMTI